MESVLECIVSVSGRRFVCKAGNPSVTMILVALSKAGRKAFPLKKQTRFTGHGGQGMAGLGGGSPVAKKTANICKKITSVAHFEAHPFVHIP